MPPQMIDATKYRTKRYNRRLPLTACTDDMHARVMSFAQTNGLKPAEAMRLIVDIFFSTNSNQIQVGKTEGRR